MKDFIQSKIKENSSRIILLVFGGLGGIQSGPNLLTELQQAHSPNLDAIVRKSVCGLWHPLGIGLTPGPLVSLLALLGYDVSELVAKENRLQPLYEQLQDSDSADSLFKHTEIKPFDKKYKLNPLLLSNSGRIRGALSPLGFDSPSQEINKAEHLIDAALDLQQSYDFIFIYIKDGVRYGKSGEYFEKIKTIEKIDLKLPHLKKMNYDVLGITGEHSIPTAMRRASWHPLPVLIQSKYCRYDTIQSFDEINCGHGGLGIITSKELMILLLANADRLHSIGP